MIHLLRITSTNNVVYYTVNINPRYSGSKYEEYCSQLSTYFQVHMTFRKADESVICSDIT
jgi:hypothetical protein